VVCTAGDLEAGTIDGDTDEGIGDTDEGIGDTDEGIGDVDGVAVTGEAEIDGDKEVVVDAAAVGVVDGTTVNTGAETPVTEKLPTFCNAELILLAN